MFFFPADHLVPYFEHPASPPKFTALQYDAVALALATHVADLADADQLLGGVFRRIRFLYLGGISDRLNACHTSQPVFYSVTKFNIYRDPMS